MVASLENYFDQNPNFQWVQNPDCYPQPPSDPNSGTGGSSDSGGSDASDPSDPVEAPVMEQVCAGSAPDFFVLTQEYVPTAQCVKWSRSPV